MTPSAVVTGGASGVGIAVAGRLLDDGWPVALVDADAEALAEAEDRLAGEDALFFSADITDEDEVAEAFDRLADTLGPVGALVNAAGLARRAPFEETSAELFRELLEINLVGSFIAARAAVERMGDELAIVNLCSVSGMRASSGCMAYGASKAGVKMMTEVMAGELASRGVRVNCLAHGPVDAPGSGHLPHEDAGGRGLERISRRRHATPADIAAAAAYLLSADAACVNGHTLVVDGGFAMAGLMRTE